MVAVVALAVIGALVTVALLVARLDQHGSSLFFAEEAASQAAYAGLDAVAANFDREWLGLGIGRSAGISPVPLGSGGARYTGLVTRLSPVIWKVGAVGVVLSPGGDTVSVRRLGLLFKRLVPDLALGATITVADRAEVDRSAVVSGDDATPRDGTWPSACAGHAGRMVPALRVGLGDTSVVITAAVVDTEFARLASIADISVGPDPVVTPALDAQGRVCLMGSGQPGNWGDPTHRAPGIGTYPCDGYFPVIHFAGPELRLTNVVGQGTLLVDGDLRIGDGVDFFGVVLVRGRLVAEEGGSQIHGAVFARDAILGRLAAPDSSVVLQYSSCSIDRALERAATVQPFARRAFMQN